MRVNTSGLFVAGLMLLAMVAWADGCPAAVEGLLSPPETAATDEVAVRALWSQDSARAGDQLLLAVIFDIRSGYHINADAAQILPLADIQLVATRITVTAATEGVLAESARFPVAETFAVDFSDTPLMTFSGQTVAFVPVGVARQAAASVFRIELTVIFQACDAHTCLFPEKRVLVAELPAAAAGKQPQPVQPALFDAYRNTTAAAVPGRVGFDVFGWRFSLDPGHRWGFVLLLVTAAFGGLLLNFTPCVLPLVPIKMISLANAAEHRSRCLTLGIATFLGVLAFWVGLGGAVALVTGFTATNQLFQYPVFTLTVGAVIAVMALGMFGVFSVRLPGFVYLIDLKQGRLSGCFGLGILTAVLSTPCTAPFMGAAAAWAATRPPLTTLATFSAIGTGMALPYLILSAAPALVAKMPRSGPASVLIKEVMGLFMLAAAAYFFGTGLSALLMEPPNPPGKAYWWVVMGFSAAAGTWLILRSSQVVKKRAGRLMLAAVGLLVVMGSVLGGWRLTNEGPIDWVHYTPERLAAATAERKVVVMVFTAEWCLNCKVLEEGVLHSAAVAALLSEDSVLPVKVDITGNNPAGKALLKSLGNLTIPLLVILAPDGREIFRSDFYTADQILEAVAVARRRSG